MNPVTAYFMLFAAACLEAGGDALARIGLREASGPLRWAFFAAGAVSLLGYGLSVNAPAWDFGRVLGVYVSLFFLVAQAINWFVFGVAPGLSTLLGGALIVAGGLVMTFARS